MVYVLLWWLQIEIEGFFSDIKLVPAERTESQVIYKNRHIHQIVPFVYIDLFLTAFVPWHWLLHLYFQLDAGISHIAPYFLDFVVCEGLSYQMMLKLSSCLPYTTTTTTTDRTNQLHHTSSANSVVVDFAVLLAVIGYTWCAITVCN